MNRFFDLLSASRPVICDGGVGTELHARIGKMDLSMDHLNVTQPDVVRNVHTDYINSGAQIIETNTFGANRIRLAAHDIANLAREINLAGVRLAKEAAGDKALVAGSIGPTGKLLEPFGVISLSEAEEAFTEQAQAFKDGGVDVIFIETMVDLQEATAAIKAAKATGLPVVSTMSFAQEGRTMMGVTPETAVKTLEDLGVDAVGANCGTGFHDMLGVVTAMLSVASKPVIAQPNAGFPAMVDGRLIYMSSPAYMADYAKQFAEIGVSIIGGCCGTTPAHIDAIAEALRGAK